MEEASPQNQNPRKPSFLGALEFGFLELAFVTVVLILFFGTLNYFNILSLSKTFPQYFSWLPTQPTPVATTKQSLTIKPTPAPKITEKQAEKDLEAFASSVINPPYTPSQLKITQISQKTLPSDIAIFIGSTKIQDNITLQIISRYKNGVLNNVRQIIIGIPEDKLETLEATSASQLIDHYLSLKIDKTPICTKTNKKFPKLTLCETSITKNDLNFQIQVQYPFQ